MHCTQCGHANNPGAKFCIECGSRLEERQWQQPESADQGAFTFDGPPQKNGVGLAAFILTMIALPLWIITIVWSISLADASLDETDPEIMALGLAFLLSFLLSLVGLVLGIVGTCLKNRRKGLSIASLCINTCVLLFVIFMMMVGASA
ncbi:MAG: zinc ribbon domain-containing protein [Desulfovibrio sp.]|nr:MAG: zinc ribbon domain-containing protein [Desulfovibrio sp.]